MTIAASPDTVPSRALHALVLGVLTLVSLPALLSGSFGVDNDAWGVLSAALSTMETGQLHVSRSPGNIVHELAGLLSTALVTRLDLSPALIPTFMGAYSFASAVAAYLLFFRIQRELNVPALTAHIAAVCLLGGPSVLIHTANGMDYLPALAFGLAAIRYRNHSHWVLVVLFNLAVGNRLSMLLYAVPLACLFWQERAPITRYLTVGVAGAIALAISTLVRMLAAPAPGTIGATAIEPLRIAGGIGFGWFGLAATLFIAAVAVAFMVRPVLVARSAHDGSVAVDWNLALLGLAGVVPQFLLYCYVPNDPAYLTGAVPFVLLLFAAFGLKSWVWLSLAACLLAANVYSIRGYDPTTREIKLHVTAGPYRISLYEHYLPGRIFDDFERLAQAAEPDDIALIVQQHGISNSFNGGWGELWKLYDKRKDIRFQPRSDILATFTAIRSAGEDDIYVLSKASPEGRERHSVIAANMEDFMQEICAQEAALDHDIHLDAEFAGFEADCRAAAGSATVQLYRVPGKNPAFDHSWMSF